MSLKSEFWVQGFIRRANNDGNFCALLQRGAPEAGAVFVLVNHLDGSYRLLGPAPGPAYSDEGDRRFIDELSGPAELEAAQALLARRKKVDPDLWIIEVEDRTGLAGLSISS